MMFSGRGRSNDSVEINAGPDASASSVSRASKVMRAIEDVDVSASDEPELPHRMRLKVRHP